MWRVLIAPQLSRCLVWLVSLLIVRVQPSKQRTKSSKFKACCAEWDIIECTYPFILWTHVLLYGYIVAIIHECHSYHFIRSFFPSSYSYGIWGWLNVLSFLLLLLLLLLHIIIIITIIIFIIIIINNIIIITPSSSPWLLSHMIKKETNYEIWTQA